MRRPRRFAKAREAGTVRAAQARPTTVPAGLPARAPGILAANAIQGVGPYLRAVAATAPMRPAVAE